MSQNCRRFTIDEVNRTIPVLERRLGLVADRFRELAPFAPVAEDRRRAGLEGGRAVPMAYFEGVRQILDETRQIEETGVIVRDLKRGLLDFPATLNGNDVFLCWVRGEERVGFFHEPEAGFAGRKPLPSDAG